jgi:hypothetical protein
MSRKIIFKRLDPAYALYQMPNFSRITLAIL